MPTGLGWGMLAVAACLSEQRSEVLMQRSAGRILFLVIQVQAQQAEGRLKCKGEPVELNVLPMQRSGMLDSFLEGEQVGDVLWSVPLAPGASGIGIPGKLAVTQHPPRQLQQLQGDGLA